MNGHIHRLLFAYLKDKLVSHDEAQMTFIKIFAGKNLISDIVNVHRNFALV